MMGFLFGVTVLGGLLGVLLGNVSFSSPFELVLPHGVRSNYYVKQLVHPGFAQVQDVLGHTSPRPKAPFAYTNSWGNNISLLLIWFVVGWWVRGSRRSKCFVVAVGCRRRRPDHLLAEPRRVDRPRPLRAVPRRSSWPRAAGSGCSPR